MAQLLKTPQQMRSKFRLFALVLIIAQHLDRKTGVLAFIATHKPRSLFGGGYKQGKNAFGSVILHSESGDSSLSVPNVEDNQNNENYSEKVENDNHSWIHKAFEDEHDINSTVHQAAKIKNRNQVADTLHARRQDEKSFPFSSIVGNHLAKQALLLAAVNPKGLGSGVLLYGGHGTGKSVLCRSVQQLLSNHQHDTKNDPSSSDKSSEGVPFITVPLHCQEDALLGTVDLERSLKEGVPVFQPGLLARADKGILYVDDIHLLDDSLVHVLLKAVTDGFVKIEREGISVEYPCRPILLASYNPTDGDMNEFQQCWVDRIAMTVPMTDALEMSIVDRVQVVEKVEGFLDKTLSPDQVALVEKEETDLRDAVQLGRALLPQVQLSKEQLAYLCEEASRADCEGQRAEIYAAEIARTSAALNGRIEANAEDLQLGVLLSIVSRRRSAEETQEELQPPQPPAPPMPQQTPPQDTAPPPPPNQQEQNDSENEEDNKEERFLSEPLSVPDRFIFGFDAVPLDPKLLDFPQWTRKGKGGKRSMKFNLSHGRFVKALIPKDWKVGKIAVGATLRAAAPYQKLRRERTKSHKLVQLHNSDFRIKRLAQKSGSLILFVVDSSGSMALNRMSAAKGAAMSLLQEAYKCRDKICLISYHDTQAEVLVPPTKSLALARGRLEAMPCGGKTPLAHALVLAIRTGLNAVKVKQDVGKVVIILLADGRANVPLCVSEGGTFDDSLMGPGETSLAPPENGTSNGQPSRQYLKDEVLAIAKQLGSLKDFDLLCIDTEDKFVGTGMAKEITRVASGTYFHLSPSTTTTKSVANIAQEGVRQLRHKHTK